jgi:hypothetical protein
MKLYKVEMFYGEHEIGVRLVTHLVKKYSRRKGIFYLRNGIKLTETRVDRKKDYWTTWTTDFMDIPNIKRSMLELNLSKSIEQQKKNLEYDEAMIKRLKELIDQL